MHEYELPNTLRIALAEHHRAFQAAVGVQANRYLGYDRQPNLAILKYEGGVRVGNREIVILADCVRDTGPNGARETRMEEIAVTTAIRAAAKEFYMRGPKALAPYAKIAQSLTGDPLREALPDCDAPKITARAVAGRLIKLFC